MKLFVVLIQYRALGGSRIDIMNQSIGSVKLIERYIRLPSPLYFVPFPLIT